MSKLLENFLKSKYAKILGFGAILAILFWTGVIQVQITVNFGNSY